MVTDVKVGLTAADAAVATILQRARKPLPWPSTSATPPAQSTRTCTSFTPWVWGDPFEVSAVHGHGTGDLLDWCVAQFPEEAGRRRKRT